MQNHERGFFSVVKTFRRKSSATPITRSAPLSEAVVPTLPAPSPSSISPASPPVLHDALEPVTSLFVIYDADGTPAGELIYITKKLLGLGHCAACDITHGPRKEKPEFTQLKAVGWGIPLVNIHRDEMDAKLASAVGAQLPCVAARTATRDVVLLGQDKLDMAKGDVLRFQKMVNAALAEQGLSAPPAPPQACGLRPVLAPEKERRRIHLRRDKDAVVPGSKVAKV